MTQLEWENLASLLSLAVGGLALLLLLCGLVPGRLIGAFERQFKAIARSRIACFILLPTLSFTINLLITLHHKGVPIPVIHDEFSYLLAADTFAHGRLTNPPPPGWEHFETPQQLMRPTYMSKYPPGQGVALAIGQILTNQPIVGVWICTAAAVAASYWMLLGFVPPTWALLGGILATLHPQLLDWSQNYWGGSVAVLGAALLLGAWGRIMIAGTVGSSIAAALGLLILANSRPYEGCVLAMPLVLSVFLSGDIATAKARRREGRREGKQFQFEFFASSFAPSRLRGRILIPAIIVLSIGATAMGYYNFRITGHPLRLPFAEYAAQYDVYPKFWFLPTRPVPAYRNPAMKFVHTEFEQGLYFRLRSWRGFWEISRFRFNELLETNLKLSVLLLPLAVSLLVKKELRILVCWIIAGIFLLGMWAENFVLPHYEAPVLPLMLLLIVVGWCKLAGWSPRGWSIGKSAARATLIGFLAGAGFAAAQPVDRTSTLVEQQALVDLMPRLQKGRHLIFVTYAPLHSFHIEYVHNLSDLDKSPIIWARSFGPESDLELARQFPGRQLWLLNVGGKLDLKPYPTAGNLPGR